MKNLPPQAIIELQEIYRKEFGVELGGDEMKAEARKLLLFFYDFVRFQHNEVLTAQKKKDIRRENLSDAAKNSEDKENKKLESGDQLKLF